MKRTVYFFFAACLAASLATAASPRAENSAEVETGASPAPTTTRYVTVSGAGTKTGLSWANAASDLQAILSASFSGDQVWVAAGTYVPKAYPPGATIVQTDARDYSFGATTAVKMYGNFAGGETAITQRVWTSGGAPVNETILSGLNTVTSVSSARVFVAIGAATSPATIDGFVFSDAAFVNPGHSVTINTVALNTNYGAGIAVQNSNTAIVNCKFRNNKGGYGAGSFFKMSTSPVTNCLFSGNQAAYSGGAVYNSTAGSPTFTNCTFVNNSVVTITPTLGNGGAIFSSSTASVVKVYNCIVWGSTVSNNAAATAINGGMLTVNNTLDQDVIAGTANISSAPHFNSATDFNLTSCSPAINAGNSSYISAATDLQGATRIQSTSVDMGAYENSWTAISPNNWGGAKSSDWSNAANWTCNFAPTAADDIAVPVQDNAPMLTATSAAKTIFLTGGNITLGDFSLTATGISGGGGASHFVTNGAGALTITTVPTTGATFPVGTTDVDYDPVTITPTPASGFTVSVKATASGADFAGTINNYAKVAPRQWNVTPTGAAPVSTVLIFTNGDASLTPTSARVGHYKSNNVWEELTATYSSNTWTATTTSFSPFGVATAGGFAAALPVELLSFGAKNAGSANLVSWQTASEKDNLRFDVERSADGKTFGFLGSVKGQNQASEYAFTDPAPFHLTYYRLRQVDFDGAETFSKIVVVTAGADASGKLRVYPSPTAGTLNVEIPGTGVFSILDVMGRTVLTGAVVPQIDVSALQAGIYILSTGAEQAKFVKQ